MVTTAQQTGGALGLAVLVSIAASRASSLPGAGLLAAGAVLAVVLTDRLKPSAGLPRRLPPRPRWRRCR